MSGEAGVILAQSILAIQEGLDHNLLSSSLTQGEESFKERRGGASILSATPAQHLLSSCCSFMVHGSLGSSSEF